MTTLNQSHQHISGKERRAHQRYPVSLTLDIVIEGVGQYVGEARDFCFGGLLIALTENTTFPAQPAINGRLCLITLRLAEEDYRLRAKIVHAEAGMFGVSFINPDQIALSAIVKYARISEQDSGTRKQDAPGGALPPANARRDVIAQQCNNIIIGHLDRLLADYIRYINESLFETSKSTSDAVLQNACFVALEAVNSNKDRIISRYAGAIKEQLNSIDALLENGQANVEQDGDTESLSLIDEDEFNAWLVKSKINHQIEGNYSRQLNEIEHRLSTVYGIKVDRKNNPYSPELFTHALQESLEPLDINHHARSALYDAFRSVLMDGIDKIYSDINASLIGNDVIPDFKEYLRQQRQAAKRGSEKQEAKPDNSEQEQTGSDTSSSRDEQVNGTSITDSSQAERPETHNLYDLVGEIRQLQQQLRGTTHGPATGSDPGLPGPAQASPAGTVLTGEFIQAQGNIPSYSTAELLETISAISTPLQKICGDGQTINEFRKNLEANLSNDSGDGNKKALSVRQNYVIDVTGNIFETLLHDLQVARSVRPWLEKLAIPVMKTALLDEGIFLDKGHVVRQVINRLADLEVLASAEDTEEQAAVRHAFNWVVSLINKEFDGTLKVYTRALQQLELLLKVQDQAFEQNIKQVVAEAIREERETERVESEDKSEAPANAGDSWLKKVHRMKENHWVLFDAYSDDPKRLKVAWVAPRNGKYVFVNVMGRKDRIHKDSELAELFRAGEAIVLDGQDESAMDRAQYTMLQNLHEQLLYQSSHDEITGLINRREFEKCLELAYADAVQNNSKHALCYIDLDKFNIINNNYGFAAGDQLLQELKDLFLKKLHENNVMARVGVDQFGILIQNASVDAALETIEDIMDEIHNYRFAWDDNRISVTFSGGLTIINATTNDVMKQYQAAESSCKIAKEMGGNSLQIYHAGSSRLARRNSEVEWASKIDMALDSDALYLRCQKIKPVHSGNNAFPHYEILLGITDEMGGIENLGAFISAAEHCNRMLDIDRWVIRNVFEWLAHNEDIVTDIDIFSINLSGQTLNNEGIIEYIYHAMSDTGVPIERICFEITETAGISNLSDAADFIETIKGTGCKFALDDFGSGMSSYSYLKSLPIDYLKIDGMFIKEITQNRSDYAVVKSICEIGHFMGKKVIAEYVQDDASVKLLSELGVDYVQGYGIERPHRLNELLT